FGGRSLRVVFVSPDDEASHPRQMQERKHVAARERRHQHFLWIDGGLDRPFANHMRRGGRRNLRPAVEAYRMRAAEAAFEELLAALLRRPLNLCKVGRHGSSSLFRLVITLANSRSSGERRP